MNMQSQSPYVIPAAQGHTTRSNQSKLLTILLKIRPPLWAVQIFPMSIVTWGLILFCMVNIRMKYFVP